MLGAIQEQVYQTIVLCADFFKQYNIWAILGGIAALYVIFMRTWEFRKIGSLFMTWLVLLILFVRLDAYFATAAFSQEGIEMAQILTRIISGIVAAIIFVYHAAIVQ